MLYIEITAEIGVKTVTYYMVEKMKKMIEKPWSHHTDEILDSLEVAKDAGLNRAEVADRKKRYGRNLLREIQKRSVWRILLEQFKNLIIVLLGAAAVLSFFFGDWLEGSAIVAVIFINAAIGFVTELKAVRSMEALRRLGSVKTRVRRDGQAAEVSADNLVPGDIVIVEGGDVVTAEISG